MRDTLGPHPFADKSFEDLFTGNTCTLITDEYTYFGECRPGTEIPEGRGIMVNNIDATNTGTDECYWRDGKRTGQIR